ncbi:MAG: VWA domain-containing protein [Bacteroidia bacterium]|nr:VWA domain-containing protein [Bacteroidia bacterium]
MKRILSYLAYLPFVLAVLWAAKVYGGKLFESNDTHHLYVLESPAPTEVIAIQQPENPTPVEPVNTAPTHRLSNELSHIQVALLLDISGSMDGLIDQAKSKLWQVVNDLSDAHKAGSNANLEIALYAYGGDHLGAEKGYVRQLAPLSTDLDLISEKLFALKTNGGEEYCGKVIESAQFELDWSEKKDDLRMIFIAGNEPFNQGNVQYQQVCKVAKQKDILVNTIFCGNYMEGINTFWKHGADLTNGAYMNIDHNVQSVHIATPYDSEISTLNAELNDTYYSYSRSGAVMKERQITQDNNAAGYGSANMAKRAISKSKGAYKNSSWDLVDAVKEKKVKVEDLKKEELAPEFQSLDGDQLKQKIEELSTKRNDIQKKIVELDKKRKSYVAEQKKNKSEDQTLDAAMSKAIRDQAKSKNYKFKN